MRGWRVEALEVGAPSALLAGSLALLDSLTGDPTPTLRWYRSTGTAIVLGRGQRPSAARARKGGTDDVEVLVRHSGGGAMLLDPSLLSLDVAVPTGHPLLDGDMGAVFERVGEAWCAALTDLGVADLRVHRAAGAAKRRGTERDRLLAAVCYATVGRGEVLAGGRKLVGLAQRRRRPGALVQCGLPRRWNPARLLTALGADPADREIAEAAVGLDDLLADPPSDAMVIDAVSARLAG